MNSKSPYAIIILLLVDTATFDDLIPVNLIRTFAGLIEGVGVGQVCRTFV